jgi:hypothetical protein
MISLIIGLIIISLTKLLIKIDSQILILVGIVISIIAFYLIGRKVILRHSIGENLNIKIDFLFHSNKTINLTRKEIKNIEFKTINFGRYGLYEKGIIIFKNDRNYHKKYFTMDINNEYKYFWTNFRYPNRI